MKKMATMALLAFLAAACSTKSENGSEKEASAAEIENRELTKDERKAQIVERINTLEKELQGDIDFQKRAKMVQAEELVRFYRDYASINPNDEVTPNYLFKAADLSIGLEKYPQAIGYMDNTIKNYPNFERRPEVMLLRGFVYEYHMNQHAEAVKAYKELIATYPNHRLSSEAQAAIDNMTMSEEELIAKLKKSAE